MIDEVICDYCGDNAERVTGKVLYPNMPKLSTALFWRCDPCQAHVGCHNDGTPYGTLARPKLRRARRSAHVAFDKLWQSGEMTRNESYKWMQEVLQIAEEEAHIAMLDLELCYELMEHLKQRSTAGEAVSSS